MSKNKNLNTKITTMGELKPGDRIIGSNNEPITVTNVYEKHFPKDMYELEMEDGEVVQASGNHLWYCETDKDILNKDIYIRLAREYFENFSIPEKIIDGDENYPLDVITKLFGEDINTIMFIEKACKSLGQSSTTPHIVFENMLKDYREETTNNYSYNDLIDFLMKMKNSIINNKGYFYFGEVRTTGEIAKIIEHNMNVNIPHKGEIQ